MSLRARVLLLLVAFALAAAPALAADLQVTEAVGAIPLHADARPASPPREAAERKALSEAVRRVALELVADLDPAEVEARLDAALGNEPLPYISRYRILEDRGERPALFSDDPEARTEYVVVVEATVYADRVRDRLARSGLVVAPAGEARRFHVRLEADGLEDFAAYQSLRKALLEGVGVRSALPLELARGRVVLDVEAELEGPALLAALQRAAPPGLRLTALESSPERLRVHVAYAAPAAAGGEPPAIDTPKPNRY